MHRQPRRSPQYRALPAGTTLVALLCAGAIALAGCGSSSTGGSSRSTTTGRPAYCTQLQSLKTSVQDLTKVNVLKDGTTALRSALERVRVNATATVNAVKGEFATQTQPLKNSLDTLSRTVKGIARSPSAAQLSELPAQVKAVSADATALVKSASSRCG